MHAGDKTTKRFLEFFAANIRNPNTRAAYAQAVRQFLDWCDDRGLGLEQTEPLYVAAYIEHHPGVPATIKQHLAALNMLFDWLVTGHVIPSNAVTSVRGPRHVVKRGKTPVLTSDEARQLQERIDTSHVVGLRDRALIEVMVYSFARVGAVVGMRVEDYYPQGKRWWFRLHEKGGKFHEVPAHHKAEAFMDAYLDAAGIAEAKKSPLFRTAYRKTKQLTPEAMTRNDAFRMIKRRAREAGLSARVCCHTFRATGIADYLGNGGTLEHAQAIAAHEPPRTTKLYDRTGDTMTLDEVEKITI